MSVLAPGSRTRAVEDHGAATHGDRKALVIVVAALLACRHGFSPHLVKPLHTTIRPLRRRSADTKSFAENEATARLAPGPGRMDHPCRHEFGPADLTRK